MRLGSAIGVLAMAAATPVLAAESASQNVSTSVQIVQPITLGKASDLAFGSIAKPSAGGNTITVDEVSGARSLSGGGDASLAASTASRAAYTVSGEGGQAFSVRNRLRCRRSRASSRRSIRPSTSSRSINRPSVIGSISR